MNILYWLRSDLRLHDNPALTRFAAAATTGEMLWYPSKSMRRAADFRRSFLWGSLEHFAQQAQGLGAKVRMEAGDIRGVLPDLLRKQRFDLIVFNEEGCSEELRDESWVRSLGVPCESFESRPLMLRKDLPFALENMPEVFTHFRKKVEENLIIPSPLPPPTNLPGSKLAGDDLGLSPADVSQRITHKHVHIESGEKAALKRLDDYLWGLDRLKVYKETRDGLLDWNDSSKLSPYLAVGALSARQVYSEILRYEAERVKNQSTYWLFFELLWRDYFYWIGLKWGSRLFTGMKASFIANKSQEAFEAWKAGRTGQPFIDAHMRELAATGWMSNRGRQNVANYLVKTLGVDWRLGASYFEEQLINYDPSSN